MVEAGRAWRNTQIGHNLDRTKTEVDIAETSLATSISTRKIKSRDQAAIPSDAFGTQRHRHTVQESFPDCNSGHRQHQRRSAVYSPAMPTRSRRPPSI
jgi:hypothetical protein